MTSSRTVEGGKKDGMLSELCITAYSSFQLSKLTDIIVTQEKRNMDAVTVGVVITARAYRLGGPLGAYCGYGWFGIDSYFGPILPLDIRSACVRAFAP